MTDNDKGQAYAKLEGDNFCYYIHNLRVTLGRTTKVKDRIDIPLGNAKSVSRQHAQLFYNFTLQRFEMTVFGKNGVFVNERFIEKGVTVPLENRAKIQIGEVSFQFLLPKMDRGERSKIEDNCISIPQQLEKPSLQKIVKNNFPKPPLSYAALITEAINSVEDKKMTLDEICVYIADKLPYDRQPQKEWQSSIRHHLSSNKAFTKVPKKESNKGTYWTISQWMEKRISPEEEGSRKRMKHDETNQANNNSELEATPETADQIQVQLQETLCQHLLDPEHYPLPPSLARLLPQAVAQLPPHLANQLSSSLISCTLKPNSNSS